MPKMTLTFRIPDEKDEMDLALKAGPMHSALWDVSQEVFRPARKHGYSDPTIAALMEKIGDDATELVAQLESKFYEILSTHSVEL